MSFVLDPRLVADTVEIAELGLSRALLMNDSRWLWLILVPRKAGASEIGDLSKVERATLIEEIAVVQKLVTGFPGVEKGNVGALGNIVRQLHVHIVARTSGDPAWPGPVWGAGAPVRYDPPRAREIAARLKRELDQMQTIA